MSAPRRVALDLLDGAMCIGAFVLFLMVFGIVFAVSSTILGLFVEAFRLDPKGSVGGLLKYVIPGFASVALGLRVVMRLDPLWARLERWKRSSS